MFEIWRIQVASIALCATLVSLADVSADTSKCGLNTPKMFIVFYASKEGTSISSSQLALEVIDVVAETAISAEVKQITLTGHTDTEGEVEDNYQTGLRKAIAVRDELIKRGIRRSVIKTISKGESDLRIQTGDDVREPQNRRVNIDLNCETPNS